MSFKFIKNSSDLIVRYTPEQIDKESYVLNLLEEKGEITLSKIFHLTQNDFIEETLNSKDEFVDFVIATENNDGYYLFNKNILGIENNLLIDCDLNFNIKMFKAYRDVSIFCRLDKMVNESIVIGGNHENAIPADVYYKFIENFPNSYETRRYVQARIDEILGDYFETMSDAKKKLSDYLKKKELKDNNNQVDTLSDIYDYEKHKYQYIHDELKEMLDKHVNISETEWQEKVLPLLLLIFPRYVCALKEVQIPDHYTHSYKGRSKPSYRRIDYMLIDSDGTVDIIELKKPFEESILSNSEYRDSFRPHKELSGAIMQVEKYLFHLNKGGCNLERKIQERYKDELPKNLNVRITNPKAMIILGRSNNLTDKQKWDFEVIRRQYANIVEIMTYDDLLDRVKNILYKFEVGNVVNEINE